MNQIEKPTNIVLISCSSPVLCGVYDDTFSLKTSFFSEEKTSDALVNIYQKLLAYFKEEGLQLKAVYYAKGPGNFTSLKLTHIFLHTLALTQGVELFSTDSFYFNQNSPIKAFGNKFFIKKSGENIELKELVESENDEQKDLRKCFSLPYCLNTNDFDTHNVPLYILPPL